MIRTFDDKRFSKLLLLINSNIFSLISDWLSGSKYKAYHYLFLEVQNCETKTGHSFNIASRVVNPKTSIKYIKDIGVKFF